MKNFTLLISLFFFALLGLQKVTAQIDYTTCKESNTFTVDTDPTQGSGDETDTGSSTSTYTWSSDAGAISQDISNSNKATINWTGVSIGTVVTITVVEKTIEGCENEPVTIKVEIVDKPEVMITSTSPICEGEDAVFTINGAIGNIITYNINEGADQTLTMTSGSEVITINAVEEDQILTITSVKADSSVNPCESLTVVTAKITVNPLPKTSPILMD